MERLVVWHRVLPASRVEQDDPVRLNAVAHDIERAYRKVRGVVLARVSGTIAVLFDLSELDAAIESAIELMKWCENSPHGHAIQASIGIACGEVSEIEGILVGSVVNRAELLANRARKSEIVVDAATREFAAATFLFDRAVGAGAAAHRGVTVDRKLPHRAACRKNLIHLGRTPVSASLIQALAEVEEGARSGKAHAFVLRGPSGSGANRYFRNLAAELKQEHVLRVGPVPAGLEPLGSLRLCLESHREKLSNAPCLQAIVQGHGGAVTDAARELAEVFGDKVWVLCDPLAGIDQATVDVMFCLLEIATPLVVFRLGVDTALPPSLQERSFPDLMIPSLRLEDAKEIARTVLGENADEDVIRRVAVFGGDSPLGVVEAARALIASGDVTFAGDRFQWRSAPRTGFRAIPVDELFQDRLETLVGDGKRLLEAHCACPPNSPQRLVDGVAALDGLGQAKTDAARSRLSQEGYLERQGTRPASEHLRKLVMAAMPPARRSELERFIARALHTAGPEGPFARASRAVHFAEGGENVEAAKGFLDAARACVASYPSAARRLSVAAVRIDPRSETKRAAAQLARQLDHDYEPPLESLATSAVNALLRGSSADVDEAISHAGDHARETGAVERVRILQHLANGEVDAAMNLYRRLAAAQSSSDLHMRGRSRVTLAWIQLHAGNAEDAIRAGLEALECARRIPDTRAEQAARQTIAACYRALGDRETAERLAR